MNFVAGEENQISHVVESIRAVDPDTINIQKIDQLTIEALIRRLPEYDLFLEFGNYRGYRMYTLYKEDKFKLKDYQIYGNITLIRLEAKGKRVTIFNARQGGYAKQLTDLIRREPNTFVASLESNFFSGCEDSLSSLEDDFGIFSESGYVISNKKLSTKVVSDHAMIVARIG